MRQGCRLSVHKTILDNIETGLEDQCVRFGCMLVETDAGHLAWSLESWDITLSAWLATTWYWHYGFQTFETGFHLSFERPFEWVKISRFNPHALLLGESGNYVLPGSPSNSQSLDDALLGPASNSVRRVMKSLTEIDRGVLHELISLLTREN